MLALHGFMSKAVSTVVTGAVGAAAYEAVRKGVAKVPLRAATVTVTAWGIRVAREAERKAGESAERARLTTADVIAEAKGRVGDNATPAATGQGTTNDD
jgi:hypothetical protein